MKTYEIKVSETIVIGDFPYFEEGETFEICDLGFGEYKGIQIKKRCSSSICNGEIYKKKAEAIEKAKKNYTNNTEFSKGIRPFEVVFHLKGIGWQIFTSNTIENEILVKGKLGLSIPCCWQQ